MKFSLFRSERSEELAFLLSQLDSGSLTLMDLSNCRSVIRAAVEELRYAEALVQSAQRTMRDELAKDAMQGFLVSLDAMALTPEGFTRVAEYAYQQADAMLAVRASKEVKKP